jgi:hypothetical protein
MDFTSSALIGHVVAMNLITKLVQSGVLSASDACEIFDDALLLLETHQKSFPENESVFQEAREFLGEYAKFYSKRNA